MEKEEWPRILERWRSRQCERFGDILTLARQEGFEPPTYCLEGSCSILLSYWRIYRAAAPNDVERVMGIEPTYPAWKAGVLPLNYTRMGCSLFSLEIITYFDGGCQQLSEKNRHRRNFFACAGMVSCCSCARTAGCAPRWGLPAPGWADPPRQ